MFFAVFAGPTGPRLSARTAVPDSDGKEQFPSEVMSFLFHKRTKKVLRWIWGVVAILISLSMVIFFAPGLPEWIAGLF